MLNIYIYLTYIFQILLLIKSKLRNMKLILKFQLQMLYLVKYNEHGIHQFLKVLMQNRKFQYQIFCCLKCFQLHSPIYMSFL